jgi:hypothetical protein
MVRIDIQTGGVDAFLPQGPDSSPTSEIDSQITSIGGAVPIGSIEEDKRITHHGYFASSDPIQSLFRPSRCETPNFAVRRTDPASIHAGQCRKRRRQHIWQHSDNTGRPRHQNLRETSRRPSSPLKRRRRSLPLDQTHRKRGSRDIPACNVNRHRPRATRIYPQAPKLSEATRNRAE